jgi:hypothetical protein
MMVAAANAFGNDYAPNIAWNAATISGSETSLTRVAMIQWWPNGSRTRPARSP